MKVYFPTIYFYNCSVIALPVPMCNAQKYVAAFAFKSLDIAQYSFRNFAFSFCPIFFHMQFA